MPDANEPTLEMSIAYSAAANVCSACAGFVTGMVTPAYVNAMSCRAHQAAMRIRANRPVSDAAGIAAEAAIGASGNADLLMREYGHE